MRPRTSVLLIGWLLLGPVGARGQAPQTVAETSNYTAGSRHADVMEFCEQLAKGSPLVRLGELGVSHEGRKLPLVIVADPSVAGPRDAGERLVVFAIGNIHAGEIDGKEALLMLARDLSLAKDNRLLKDLVLVFAPIFNADGNERLGAHRPTQAGPEQVGTRANAQGFDLNRDFVKLESPEVRALVRFVNAWNPAVVIDCHTTNGSYHRYAITYEGGRCPAGDVRVIDFTREVLLPGASRRLAQDAGLLSYFYGNFNAERTRWETVAPTPRYGTHYMGLRNRIAVLSESYTYAPYKDRVVASKAFVQAVLETAAAERDKIRRILGEASEATVQAGRKLNDDNRVALRQKAVAWGRPVNILGFVEERQGGRRVPTAKPRDYEVAYLGGAEPTLSVRRPYGYLIPENAAGVIANLQRHGVAVDELRDSVELDVEAYRIDKITRAPEFQKHRLTTLDATPRTERRRLAAGTRLVRTAQPLGSLAAYLLEPQAEDGLAAWNFFDSELAIGRDFAILRLPATAEIATRRLGRPTE
jgi:murein tripeptide amidase MpaA